ncbi:assimilatory nitrate reductase catalytic subunit [Kineosphaera limosa]|uniref:Putative molybdopterin oxidoreductase n=1 Tax=Kineosphaera limosa NBRC 100340 TaxID=1184609 RepID=K6WLA2_9MICO|nr:molybdopterin oxidoreductase family protein [Kineosphaera limosa]NYD99427.1 assimilatory nitrate reductase catalytic subunit [Kineosphaera limosa]GAB94591.1 putative molybdopterin oxidoreductase [Kineosphaera limosa NBRC 100340]
MTDTHCPYCSLQCGMRLTVPAQTSDRASSLEVTPRDFPTNAGGLCAKGWTSAQVLDVPDRLTTPLLRGPDGALHPASWEDALSAITGGLRDIWAAHGRSAVGVFGGGGLTNEKAYTLGKFARVALRTPFIDYNGRFCMSSAAAAGNRAFGLDRGLPFPLTDLAGADAILLLGSNVAETMPPALRHLSGARERGGLLVVDPRRTATAALTDDEAGLHLQPLPGTDLQLLLGLTHVVFAEGLADTDYLRRRVDGVGAVRREVAQWWPERVERETGVPADLLRRAAHLLAAAAPGRGGAGAYVLTGRGAEQHAHGTDTVTAAIGLALALGLPGVPGSGYGCLTGQGNGQGGREHGQKADQLPGYRSIGDPAARAHVAQVWGVDPELLPGPGVPAVELFKKVGRPAAEGGIRALFVHGANPVVSAPDAGALEARLRRLDLLVVADLVPSETAQLADVVLPITQWAEESGTMTSLEGRILARHKAIEPPPGVRDELWVWRELAARLAAPAPFSDDPHEVLAELARASAGGIADYGGVTMERATREALYWPCPSAEHPGTPRVFLDRFATPDGRARMLPVSAAPVADDLRPEAPLYLVTGRVLEHYQSGAQTRRVPQLARAQRQATVTMHPVTADRLGIEEGTPVRLTSQRAVAVATAVFSTGIRPDVVFMPFHFAGRQRANLLTNPTTDPISGMPEFKVCAVDVASADTPAARLALLSEEARA